MVDAMRRPLLAAAAVAAAGALAASLLVPLPDPFPLVRDLTGALGAWSYAVVAAVVFLETSVGLGLLSPGEVVLAVSGAAAGTGDLSLAILLPVVWTCGVAGDSVSWLAGKHVGPRALAAVGRRLGVTRERLEGVEDLFRRRGGAVLVGGRFVGPVRVLAPFVAGGTGWRYARFLPWDVAGILLWGSVYVLAGYAFAAAPEQATSRIGQAGLAALLVSLLALRLTRRAASSSG
jgi:undecaprenyl-diphosphatase